MPVWLRRTKLSINLVLGAGSGLLGYCIAPAVTAVFVLFLAIEMA
jgi:hypothetical protein